MSAGDVEVVPGLGVRVPSATVAGITYLVQFHGTGSGRVHWQCDHNVVRFGAQQPLVRVGTVPCSHARRAAAVLVQAGLVTNRDGVYSVTAKARFAPGPAAGARGPVCGTCGAEDHEYTGCRSRPPAAPVQ